MRKKLGVVPPPGGIPVTPNREVRSRSLPGELGRACGCSAGVGEASEGMARRFSQGLLAS